MHHIGYKNIKYISNYNLSGVSFYFLSEIWGFWERMGSERL